MIRKPWAIVGLLSALNLINYLDRTIVAAVGPRVEADLGLSDFQFGLVVNAFMVGYFATSPAFGALGDRLARKGLIALGVAIWCVATAASGLTHSLGTMLLARLAVGVGEASYATLAPTIIDDLAEPSRKNRFLAVFYVAIPIGSALGYVLGGKLENAFGWRAAFFFAGGPGLALALVTLLIAEPRRKLPFARSTEPSSGPAERVFESWMALLRIPTYRNAVAGYTLYTFALGGFAAWAPKYLCQHLQMPLHDADFWFGAVLVLTGLLATFLGGMLGDRWPGADRARANLRVCGVTAAASVPFAVVALLVHSPVAFFATIGITEFALFLSTSPINVVILQAVPDRLRASAMALSIFAIHLLGDMVSPPLIGAISDSVSLRAGMFLLPAALVAATALWWRGSAPERVSA